MKKLLALVLALVMSMSLVTISNAAFKDADKISNKEAVDVMAAVGVLVGYDNGEFGATDTLTRAQACKIIAYLDLGKDVAEALPAVQVFSDLPANNWAAKYVAYCADAGYVSGVGDNKFAPDEKVTGYQFGKMLLCALGYDATIEEMTGASWTIKVAKLMEKNSISKGTSKLGAAVLTREEAAQYALNALKATTVEYDEKGSTITAGDVTIVTGAKKAQAVTGVDTKYASISNDGVIGTASATNPYTVQLGEKLYKGKLELGNAAGSDADKFDRPTKAWKYEGKTVATTTADADYTYYGEVSGKTLYADLGLTATTTNASFFSVTTNGTTDGTNSGHGYQNFDKKTSDTVLGGLNCSVELYAVKNPTTGAVTGYNVYQIDYEIAKISAVTEADEDDADSKRTITVAGYDFETASFAKDEYVLYAVADGEDAGMATIVKKADSVKGAVESIKGHKATISGNTYDFYDAGSKAVDLAIGDEGTFYLGIDGEIAAKDLTAADTGAYAYIYNIVKKSDVNSTGVADATTYTAYYVTESGVLGSAEMKTKTVSRNTYVAYFNSTNTGINVTDLTQTGSNEVAFACEYKISDGKFVALSGKKAVVTDNLADNILSTAGYSNAATKFVFFYVKSGDMVAKVMTSSEFSKFDSAVANIAVVTNSKNIATYVFVPANAVSLESDKTVAYLLDATPTVTKSGDDTFYTYSVMADAEVTTLTWKNSVDMVNVSVGDPFVYTLENNYLKTANGTAVTTATADKVILKAGDQIVDKMLDSSIVVAGVDYKLADNCVTYKVTEKDNVCTYRTATVSTDDEVILITNGKAADNKDLRIVAIIIDKRA